MANAVHVDTQSSTTTTMTQITLRTRIWVWMTQNLRSILSFFLPFIQSYIGIEPPPNQTDQRNDINPHQPNNNEVLPNQTDQRNNGEPARPRDVIYIARKGEFVKSQKGKDVKITTRYTENALRGNVTNPNPIQIPNGYTTAVFGQGPTVMGDEVGNVEINSTYG